jgi:hypothetical protein
MNFNVAIKGGNAQNILGSLSVIHVATSLYELSGRFLDLGFFGMWLNRRQLIFGISKSMAETKEKLPNEGASRPVVVTDYAIGAE